MKLNPITQHLTRNHHWPPLWGAVLIAVGLCAISMTAFVLGMEVAVQTSVFITWALMVLNPLVIAVLSPTLVQQAASDENYQLLKLTALSHAEIQHGFTRAALFRVRMLLAAHIGLLPMWVAELSSDWYVYLSRVTQEDYNIAVLLVINALMGVGLFGLNLLAVIFGVRQGLRSDNLSRNIVVSLALVLLLPVFCFIPTMSMTGPTLLDLLTIRIVIGLFFVLFILLPYGLAATLYWWPDKPKR